ncbi:MAG: PAS domain S-box protein [Acidobacteria bacterium]|nr:PAS domain S-box protein [Acidobacteriota bacterium]
MFQEREIAALHRLVQVASQANSAESLCAGALDAVAGAMQVDRAAILLADASGQLRFTAWTGLSETYRQAVDGHNPWAPGVRDPSPVVVNEADTDPGTRSFSQALALEEIRSLAFIPLVHQEHLIGKFVLYGRENGCFGPPELRLARALAGAVAPSVVRLRQEGALRERETWLEALFKALPVMIYEAETGSPFGATWVSPNVRDMTGFPAEVFLTEPDFWSHRIHPEDREQVLKSFREARMGVPIEVKYRWQVSDGSYHWFLERAEPREPLPGGRFRLVGIWYDITDRMREGEALVHSEEKFARAFHGSPDALLITRLKDGVLLDVNEGFLEVTGWKREEAVGRSTADLGLWVHPEDRQRLIEGLQRNGFVKDLESTFRGKGGRTGIGWVSAALIQVDGEPCVLTVSRDITERKRFEEAMRASEASYRGLFDCVRDAIYVLDQEGRFLDVNQGAVAMYGYAREELIGMTPASVSASGRNDLVAVGGMLEQAFHGRPQHFEFWGRRKNGEPFPKEVRLYPGNYFGKKVVIALAQDITERKRAEESLRQTQKLESLGLLAGGIAHDFNNLLTALLGNLNLAQARVHPSSPALANLADMERILLRASDLTNQMLAYSGRGHFVVKAHDLNALVREMADLLRVTLPKKVRLELDLSPDLPAVLLDGSQAQQVVMNLVTNAADAIGESEGRILIATEECTVEAGAVASAVPGQTLPPGPHIRLRVVDSGCGMTPEVQARIFDPFFTTKSKGRGLGLSAMLGILRGHGGGLRIQTDPGRGCEFQVFFPVRPGGSASPHQAKGGARPHFQGTVLLVDDEEIILESTGEALRSFGLDVLCARDGVQALDQFRQRPDLALVLMDVSMPRMDGPTAFLAMRELRPGTPVLLSSGFDQGGHLEALKADGLAGFLPKPYRVQDLAAALRNVLDPATVGLPPEALG